MKLSKAVNRDRRKKNKRKMGVSGKSVFTIKEIQIKRAKQIKQARLEKGELENG
jgi:G:T-mismatch repair DNA endonuclease (very short patch repair protein)